MSTPPRTDAQRRARRDAALRLHPDRGGDPQAFIAALRQIDDAHAVPLATAPSVHPTIRGRLSRTVRRTRGRAAVLIRLWSPSRRSGRG